MEAERLRERELVGRLLRSPGGEVSELPVGARCPGVVVGDVVHVREELEHRPARVVHVPEHVRADRVPPETDDVPVLSPLQILTRRSTDGVDVACDNQSVLPSEQWQVGTFSWDNQEGVHPTDLSSQLRRGDTPNFDLREALQRGPVA